MATDSTFSTAEAAAEIGISRQTLLRWFRERRVTDVARDRNGWRVFTKSDISRIIETVENAKAD
ncbi:MAG: MerR family transcriptional regulator [Pseudomonadota bacterium]